ncbi:metal-dependent hydrolase [Nonlabens sp.]|uniref:metal-dependent hydrolase n=1 Tax=Nonlabens sp. TaxID=1888209 RepID=UPI003F69FF66
MDSLTQIVLGAAVGEAVLGKKIGNKAIMYGAIAGTIPDLDVLAKLFTDTITATEFHRGFSHSIVFCVMFAPVLGWLVNKTEKKYALGWRAWSWLFFLGLFTHPVLDAFTTWGTQLLWPFDTRIALNSIFVIDPLYTVPFLICVIWVMFLKRNSVLRWRVNQAGLVISTSYLLLTLAFKTISTQEFTRALDSDQVAYKRLSTRPSPMNTILWNCNVETDSAYLIGDYSFFDTKPIKFVSYPKNTLLEQTLKPASQQDFKRLKEISQNWYLLSQENESLYYNDLRFGLIPKRKAEPEFVFKYKLIEHEDGMKAIETEKTSMDAMFVLTTIWERVKGN